MKNINCGNVCVCLTCTREAAEEGRKREEEGNRRRGEREEERGEGGSSCESEVKSSTTTLITPRAEIIKTILTMMPVLEKYELYMKLVKQGRGERGCTQARISP